MIAGLTVALIVAAVAVAVGLRHRTARRVVATSAALLAFVPLGGTSMAALLFGSTGHLSIPTLALLAAIVTTVAVIATVVSQINPEWFETRIVNEDGPVEWATVGGLALGCLVCLVRAWKIRLRNGAPFLCGLLGLGAAFFFGCGEEISWGQRLFDVHSPEWFQANNLQGETNLHNLAVGDVKINVLLFSQAIAVMGVLYFVVLPILTARNPRLAGLAGRWAIPIPPTALILHTLVLAAFIALVTATDRKHELIEMSLVSLFVIIITWPRNAAVFQAPRPEESAQQNAASPD